MHRYEAKMILWRITIFSSKDAVFLCEKFFFSHDIFSMTRFYLSTWLGFFSFLQLSGTSTNGRLCTMENLQITDTYFLKGHFIVKTNLHTADTSYNGPKY